MVISVNLGVVIAGLPNSLPYTGQSNLTALYTHSGASKTKSLRICVCSVSHDPSKGAELERVGIAQHQWPRRFVRYSDFSTKSLSAPDSAPQISPLRPASCRTFA
jgi:hypothetical protein